MITGPGAGVTAAGAERGADTRAGAVTFERRRDLPGGVRCGIVPCLALRFSRSFTSASLSGWRSRFRADHLGLLLTLAYLFLGALGMLHEALIFSMFRINILDFAEPSYFLVSALRDPLIVVVSLVAVPVVALYYRFIVRANARPERQQWWRGTEAQRRFVERHYTALFVATTFLYAVVFSLSYVVYVAKQLRAGEGRRLRAELVADPGHFRRDSSALLMLGATQKYLFLYDRVRQVTSIVPSSNIARVVVERRKVPNRTGAAPGQHAGPSIRSPDRGVFLTMAVVRSRHDG